MATPLSILISDPNCCLTFQRLGLTSVSSQPLRKPRMKSPVVCVLSCSAFHGFDCFNATVSIRNRQQRIDRTYGVWRLSPTLPASFHGRSAKLGSPDRCQLGIEYLFQESCFRRQRTSFFRLNLLEDFAQWKNPGRTTLNAGSCGV
jgi:hypothetical protein